MGKQEIKIVFAGPVGAGKTTAIGTISDVQVVGTEAIATDDTALIKPTTTVALDYGEVAVDDDLILRLYGTPGQARFAHMWPIVSRGALGIVLLIDNSRRHPLADFNFYLDHFGPYARESALIVGITKSELGTTAMDDYHAILAERGEIYPLMSIDPRSREDVLMLLDSLFTLLEDQP
jgi:signal recognition particle receptor subunit beta